MHNISRPNSDYVMRVMHTQARCYLNSALQQGLKIGYGYSTQQLC